MNDHICPHCGNPVRDEEALLCLFCGEDLERPVAGTLGMIRHSSRWAVAVFVLALLLVFCVLLYPEAASGKDADLAGSWYSSSPDVLRDRIEGYLSAAGEISAEGRIVGAVAPHAGYAYSGEVAGRTYKALMEARPGKVVLVGFTHRGYYPGKIAVFSDRAFVTPLGECVVDRELSDRFLSFKETFSVLPAAFTGENSIELQVPFIQTALADADLAILAVADQRRVTAGKLADALYEVLKDEEDFAIIVSTDMCHYLSYADAVERDSGTIKALSRMDGEWFYDTSERARHELMCGYGAVSGVLEACKRLGADRMEVLKYANSGDTAGDKKRVVGYLSALFVESDAGTGENPVQKKGAGDMFDKTQKRTLLKIARDSIQHYLETGEYPAPDTDDPALKENLGAFVTLHKGGSLRGCIGNMTGTGPLDRTIQKMAVAAAFQDPRFPRLRPGELEEVDIEISVLSPMEKIDDPDAIEMGKHGVLVTMGRRSGVYLPQVAVETGWSREEFMNSLCAHKAGIPIDSWKTGECEIFVYTAEVFGEKAHEENL